MGNLKVAHSAQEEFHDPEDYILKLCFKILVTVSVPAIDQSHD